jgi:hypothetical protein
MPYADNCSPPRAEPIPSAISRVRSGSRRGNPLRSCPSRGGDNAGSTARHTVSKWRSRRARNYFVLLPGEPMD